MWGVERGVWGVGCGMQATEGQSSKQGTARLRDSELNPLGEPGGCPSPEHSAPRERDFRNGFLAGVGWGSATWAPI